MVNNKHKIVIFEGADRVGKSSTIDKVIEMYEAQNYVVVTMFHEKLENKIIFDDNEKFDSIFKQDTDKYSVQSASLDVSSYWMQKIFAMFPQNNVVILIDRLHLTSLVFGLTLRRQSFLDVFKTTNQFIDFMNIFERRIQKFADVTLLICINDSKIDKDDNENPLIKMSVEKLNFSNSMFEIVQSTSVIKNKYVIYCKTNDIGWFNTSEQIIDILSKTM